MAKKMMGAVRYEHRANSMADIPANKMLLAVVDELNRGKVDA